MEIRFIAAVAAAGLFGLHGCSGIADPAGDGFGGQAGVGGSGGSPGGGGGEASGGSGGGGGVGGSGGGGGVGGSGEGRAGSGGESEPGWLSDPLIWTEIDLEAPVTSKLYRGDSAGLQFPDLVWEEDCGHGCSSLRFTIGDVTNGAVLGSVFNSREDGNDAYLTIYHVFLERLRYVRRMIRLSDGADISALNLLRGKGDRRISMSGEGLFESPAILNFHYGEEPLLIWGVHGVDAGWDLKMPGRSLPRFAMYCFNFGLSVEPPVYFFACSEGLHVMDKRGSSESTLVPGSEGVTVVGGAHGKAVWAQHIDDEEERRISRVQSWEPGGKIEFIADLPGDVCALAVAKTHVAGFRGDKNVGSAYCGGFVDNPRLFWISGEGEVAEGPILPAAEMIVKSIATTEHFTAVRFLLAPEISHGERMRVMLVRHSDKKMRQFAMPPAGFTMGNTTVALDDDYLYYTQWNSRPGDHSFDAVYRYRLDLFDEIGIPYPPDPD